jgi:hypothetical protein
MALSSISVIANSSLLKRLRIVEKEEQSATSMTAKESKVVEIQR